MQEYIDRLKNKISGFPVKFCGVLVLVFAVWVIFFDNNSLVNMIKLKGEINELENERDYYLDKIEKDNRRIQELKTNKKNLEKFAREQYLMKKKNEDIYIIINKNED